MKDCEWKNFNLLPIFNFIPEYFLTDLYAIFKFYIIHYDPMFIKQIIPKSIVILLENLFIHSYKDIIFVKSIGLSAIGYKTYNITQYKT